MEFNDADPLKYGFPVARPRRHTYFINRKRCVFVGSSEECYKTFQATLELHGDVYFADTRGNVAAEFSNLVRKRSMDPDVLPSWDKADWKECYAHAAQSARGARSPA